MKYALNLQDRCFLSFSLRSACVSPRSEMIFCRLRVHSVNLLVFISAAVARLIVSITYPQTFIVSYQLCKLLSLVSSGYVPESCSPWVKRFPLFARCTHLTDASFTKTYNSDSPKPVAVFLLTCERLADLAVALARSPVRHSSCQNSLMQCPQAGGCERFAECNRLWRRAIKRSEVVQKSFIKQYHCILTRDAWDEESVRLH